MASNLDYVEYVCEQLAGAGTITYKKMFGEYGLYCDGKFFASVEDDQLYVKMTKAGEALIPDPVIAEPHEGARAYLIEDLDDREFLTELTLKTCGELPDKPKKLDYKKEYKDLYMPKTKPAVIQVPEMIFIMVDGKGDPKTSAEYKNAIEILYGLSYSIKMSKMGGNAPEGYFEYVVPPLEGLWWLDKGYFDGKAIGNKDEFQWTSMIRQPEFVTEDVFEEAKAALAKKKPQLDLSAARYTIWEEGLCAQVMHKGSYDDEPATIEKLEQFIEDSGYASDISHERWHHEIYLSDPRKAAAKNLKTVIRHPIRRNV